MRGLGSGEGCLYELHVLARLVSDVFYSLLYSVFLVSTSLSTNLQRG